VIQADTPRVQAWAKSFTRGNLVSGYRQEGLDTPPLPSEHVYRLGGAPLEDNDELDARVMAP
jgi:hypothetical protein